MASTSNLIPPLGGQARRGQGSADFKPPQIGSQTKTRSVTTEATMQDVLDQGHQNWIESLQSTYKVDEGVTPLDVNVEGVVGQLQLARKLSAADAAGREFLPLGKLLEILTPAVATGILRKTFQEVSEEELEEMTAAIYVNGSTSSLKIMGTLMLIGKLELFSLFVTNHISDNSLPLQLEPQDRGRPDDLRPRMLDHEDTPLDALDTAKWNYAEAESFVTKQAQLCAPFFTIRDDISSRLDYYELPRGAILPFLDIGRQPPRYGGFGTVSKVKIEPSHLSCPTNTPKPQYLAIKKLHHHDTTSDIHPSEVEALARRVVVPNRSRGHVSRLLFTFLLGDAYFLAFEWADANLAELWKRSPKRFRPSNHSSSCWFFEQCLGLVYGLDGIHNSRGSFKMVNKNGGIQRHELENAHGRHSDIKPENILLYETSEANKVPNEHGTPRLVLADLGCAQFNTTQTKSKVRISRVSGMSVTYSAPESETIRVIGPKYDVWALGCVFLEHAAVFIEGSHSVVDDFSSERNLEDQEAHTASEHSHKYTGNTFYRLCDPGVGEKKSGFCNAVTKKTVTDWVSRLQSHANCSLAMKDFLQLVCDGMLVVDSNKRWTTDRLKGELQHITKGCSTRDYACPSSMPHQRTEDPSRHARDEALLHVGKIPGIDQVLPGGTTADLSEQPEDPHKESNLSTVPEIVLPTDASAQIGYQAAREQIERLGRQIAEKAAKDDGRS